MAHVGGGIYQGMWYPEQKGTFDVSVMLAEPGGLLGTYYDNVWFLNTPTFTRVDPMINFNWAGGPITTYGSDYVSVRWQGKVRPDYTEPFVFYINADDGARLWIDKVLVADSWAQCCNESWGPANLTKNFYHDIILEYKQLRGTPQ